MSDLLAEVDEAMRQERLAKFWHENKSYIITFIALTIIGTGALSAYRSWDQNTKTTQTAQLIELQQAADYPNNIVGAELDFRPSIRGIALLSAAGTALQRDNKEDAAALYARLAEDTKVPDQFRYLGVLMNTRLESDNEDADQAQLLSALQPIISSKSAWKPHAQIDAALLQAETNPQNALKLLNAVSDTPNLPASLYERAQKLHHVIAGNVSSNETAPETNTVQTN